jgi:regulator of replication initiation timing
MPAKTLTADEQAAAAVAELDQANAQIAVLNRRVSDLASAQTEAAGLREENAKLQVKLDAQAEQLKAALKETSAANAAAKDALASAASGAGKQAAAQKLAEAIRELSK